MEDQIQDNVHNIQDSQTKAMSHIIQSIPGTSNNTFEGDFESDTFQVSATEEAPLLDYTADISEHYGILNSTSGIIFDHGEFFKTSLDELWNEMEPIPTTPYVRKRMVYEGDGEPVDEDSIVNIRYACHFQYREKPFDGTFQHDSKKLDLNDACHVLPGIILSILTMRVGEYSQFVASHEVMYGELGCPYFALPKAKCFIHVRVVSKGLMAKKSDEETVFTKAYTMAKNVKKVADKQFSNQQYHLASNSYMKARRLINCRLCDEHEERIQQNFLAKLLLNNAICQNKLNIPARACTMCNELNLMGRLFNSPKALFQNGKALSALGDFKQAKRKFIAAYRLEPKNKDIQKEIDNLKDKVRDFDKNMNKRNKYRNQIENDNTVSKFSKAIEEMCLKLINDVHVESQKLPEKLSEEEVNIVINHALDYGLLVEEQNNGYILSKQGDQVMDIEYDEDQIKFSEAFKETCQSLLNDENMESHKLPENLSEVQLQIVLQHASEYGLVVEEGDDNIYVLSKQIEPPADEVYDENDKKFLKAFEDLCLSLITNENLKTQKLPENLTEKELSIVLKYASEYGLNVEVNDDNVFMLFKPNDHAAMNVAVYDESDTKFIKAFEMMCISLVNNVYKESLDLPENLTEIELDIVLTNASKYGLQVKAGENNNYILAKETEYERKSEKVDKFTFVFK